MKILILGFTKLKYMPYLNFYLENMNKEKNEINVVYWNRDLMDEDVKSFNDIILHEFRCFQEDDVSKIKKLNSFRKYRKYVIGLLNKESFDCLVILHSLTGVLIADHLKKSYKYRYIFDYRDSTYEKITAFKKIVESLTRYSYATFVSSNAFRRFLPNNCDSKIFTSHNMLLDSLNFRDEKKIYGKRSDKIRISFWGLIRHEEVNRKVIDRISEDDRFELHYYGREQQTAARLKDYVIRNKIENVFFHGEYKPEERYMFVRNTDLIHNIYYDNNTMLAMGNKFYDSIIFYLPQLCMTGSYMGELAEKFGVGLQCDPNLEDFCHTIYKYYSNLEQKKLENDCDKSLSFICEEIRQGAKIIKSFVED